MAYYPLQRRGAPKRDNAITTTMGVGGVNIRQLPQFLDPKYALIIDNYLTDSEGRLEKRGGLERLFEHNDAASGGTLLDKYTDDIYIFGYSNKVKAYTISTDTVTDIKTDFTTDDAFSGVRYGDYYFVCNGGDPIGRISQTLNYDNQTSNFTVGQIVTGATSGATAIILEDNDAGATGTLTLGSIVGIFQDNEALSGSGGGDGTADGTVSFAYTEISGAPKAKVLFSQDARLFAGNTSEDASLVRFSAVDDGSNPPFTNWTVGTDSTDPGQIRFGNGGAVQAISSIGSQYVVFGEDGKFAFRITTIDSAGTLKQDNPVDFQRKDFGGSRAAINTPEGLFYVNEAGLWQMIRTGRTNVPFSDNEAAISQPLLGKDFFDNANLDNADIFYDDRRDILLITYGQDSAINNQVLVYDMEQKSYSTISGWNVNRFMRDGDKVYGISSVTYESTPELRVWELFKNHDDDGEDIWTEYYQEINFGALYTRKSMNKQYFQGQFSPGTSLNIDFDIFDRDGVFIQNKARLVWDAVDTSTLVDGWGTAQWGQSTWGGDVDIEGISQNFNGYSQQINNFQRMRIRITNNDKEPHFINWVSLVMNKEIPIRKRGLMERVATEPSEVSYLTYEDGDIIQFQDNNLLVPVN